MPGWRWLAVSAATAIAFGACSDSVPDDRALAAEIEGMVVSAHRDLNLDSYARIYAHLADGSVTGLYLFANKGMEPMAGHRGQVEWTTPEAIPVVNDGGCTVITVFYDVHAHRLSSVRCNSDVDPHWTGPPMSGR